MNEWFFFNTVLDEIFYLLMFSSVIFLLIVLRNAGVVNVGGGVSKVDAPYNRIEGWYVFMYTSLVTSCLLILFMRVIHSGSDPDFDRKTQMSMMIYLPIVLAFLLLSLYKEFVCAENYIKTKKIYWVWYYSMGLISLASIAIGALSILACLKGGIPALRMTLFLIISMIGIGFLGLVYFHHIKINRLIR